MTGRSLRSWPVSGLVLAVALVVPAVARADGPDINNLPAVPDSTLAATVRDIDLDVRDIDLPDPRDVETTSTEGSEQIVTLSSDILFAFDKAVIPARAKGKVGELVADLPQRAKVSVGGHTDSLGTAARNRTLSQQRAAAVAAVVKAARPDLVLTVKGFGSTDPVAPNTSGGKDDPEGRAKNRRVELRYAG